MTKIKNKWPSIEEVSANNQSVDLAPYGVISEYAEAVYSTYNKRLLGIITSRFREKANGDRTNFVYSFYLSQVKKDDAAQIKIFEVNIQDDGWYPATVALTKPYREEIGVAETEEQLRTFIENSINSDFVKSQIKSLLVG